jgi:hypothetical protein
MIIPIILNVSSLRFTKNFQVGKKEVTTNIIPRPKIFLAKQTLQS